MFVVVFCLVVVRVGGGLFGVEGDVLCGIVVGVLVVNFFFLVVWCS